MTEVVMRPLRDIVVVEVKNDPVKTAGGLIMPTSSSSMTQRVSIQGTVVAVGPEVKNVKIGDIAVFNREKSLTISQQEKDLFLMKEKVVLGILPPKT